MVHLKFPCTPIQVVKFIDSPFTLDSLYNVKTYSQDSVTVRSTPLTHPLTLLQSETQVDTLAQLKQRQK